MDTQKVNKCLNYLKRADTNKKLLLSAFLEECTYDELECVYQKAPTIYKGLLSLSYLKRTSYEQIYGSNIQPHREIKEYLGVLTYVLKHNVDIINRYVEYKRDIDRYVLLGNYKQARDIIEKVNKELSYSYWAATYQIKIERLENGLDACTKLYNRLFQENKTIVQYVYYCAYRSSSLDFILDDVKRALVSDNVQQATLINNYLISHCMPYLGFTEGDWMCTDMNSSIIDLYNNLINFLPNLKEETQIDPTVTGYLKILNSYIKDKYLNKLCYLFGASDNASEDEERTTILEAYWNEAYDQVQQMSQAYLLKNVDDFEIQSIYLKSQILRGGHLDKPEGNSPLIDLIRYHYSEILAHKSNLVFHKRRLYNICRSQYHILGLRYLHSLLEGIDTIDINEVNGKLWKYSDYNTPLDACFYKDKKTREMYIKEITNESTFWNNVFDEHPKNISTECFEISLASLKGDELFGQIKNRFAEDKVASYIKDLIATYIFNHYIDNQKDIEGIKFYVESRLTDKALTIGFRDKDIIIALVENNTLAQIIPLDLSVFSEMAGADPETIYFIYKKYLKKCCVSKASEISVNGDEKLRYFLERVATPKVLTLHVLRFKSVTQVMEERRTICSNLYDYYQEKSINDEISTICRDIKIMELNNQVDESKIYVDIQSIKENEIEEARDLYDMFESASNQVAYQDLVVGEIISRLADFGVQMSYVHVDENGELKVDKGAFEQVNYRRDILIQLFKIIRDKFLFNPKYGLDNYLSTRIRHGTLVNKLRNHFEERQLVTNTIEGEYSHNEYWISQQFKLKDNKTLECIKLFESFSRGIDVIIDEVKDSYIQVQTEENQEKSQGCFDYDLKYFADDIDNLLYNETVTSFDICFQLIVDSLWQRTEKCLEQMRTILNDAQAEMIVLLHSLQRDVISVIGDDHPKKDFFNDAISFCQNGIQTDFQIVTKWFKRSNYVDFDFTMDQVIRTSLDFIQRNNKNQLRTKVKDESTSTFQGRYFGTLYDIFHDLLNNALNYERTTGIGGVCDICVEENDGKLMIEVSNPIRKEDVFKLKQKVDEINKNLAETIGKGKTRNEKNSGCSKIYNAVKYHLGSQSNQYSNDVRDEKFVVTIQIEIKPIKE